MSAKLNRIYGNPGSAKRPNPAWQKTCLRTMKLPYKMRIAWNTSQTVTTCQVHYKVLPYLEAALWDLYNYVRKLVKAEHGYNLSTEAYDTLTAAKLRELGLDLFGGTYCHRLVRGGTELSTHAYGCAIDLDPKHNPLGKVGRIAKSQMWVVEIFRKRGFTWGGVWKRKDGQHFEKTD